MGSNLADTNDIKDSQAQSSHQEISIELSDIPQNGNALSQDPLGITEAIRECQKGNFNPALDCLRNNLMPKDFLDEDGYSVLHYAVSQDSIADLLTLLNEFRFDVNFRSQSEQTPLMIACNYGHIEIIRLLIERGAQVNVTDDKGFDPLLYSVKQGFNPQIAYLLHHQADATTRDIKGCTVIHWAAYKNNVFLLELFKRLGFDLNVRDATGLTPLERAVQGGFCESVKYLLENGDAKMPESLDYDSVINPKCKKLLRKQYFPTKFEKLQKASSSIYTKHSQKITFGVYAFLWFSMMTIYIKAAMSNVSGDIYQMIFFLLNIYFIWYSVWYFLKSGQLKTKGYQKFNKTSNDLDDTINSRNSVPRFNSNALDKLVKGESCGTVIHEGGSDEPTSFLHELAWNFETKNFEAITKFNEDDYCPECLQKKPERGHHPEESRICVPYFHHYSYTLGRSIDRNNHYLYLLLLISQAAILEVFFRILLDTYSEKLEQGIFDLLRVGFNLFKDFGLVFFLIYMKLLTLAMANWLLLAIELWCLSQNITVHEISNLKKCPYLWESKEDSDGRMKLCLKNKYNVGVLLNVKEYIKRIIN